MKWKVSLLAAALLSLICLTCLSGSFGFEKPTLGYVGSLKCKECHENVYKEYQTTLHSRTMQDARKNPRAIVGDFDSVSGMHSFKKTDVLYTLGYQWKQRYITGKGGELDIFPAQWNMETGRWVPYRSEDWKRRAWLKDCGGCHVTGLNLQSKTFVEPGVGCEACHGPGKEHSEAKNIEDYEKTIVNPRKLPVGLEAQICGSCHTRGSSPDSEHGYPVNFMPGAALIGKFKESSRETDKENFWPNGHSKGHHQQYLDWTKSQHVKEGVSCVSCHLVHNTNKNSRYQIRLPGDTLCLDCHKIISSNPKGVHGIHPISLCLGCHMPRVVKSAETGDLHDHTFKPIKPAESIAYGGVDKQPNSCNSCHHHKDDSPAELQKILDKIVIYKKTKMFE